MCFFKNVYFFIIRLLILLILLYIIFVLPSTFLDTHVRTVRTGSYDPRVYWTTSKTFLEKSVSKESITMTLLWRLKTRIRKKHYVWNYYARKSNLTRSYTCLEIFQSTNDTNQKGHGVLFQTFSEVCCCFSPLLREVFLRVLRFPPLLK